MGAGRSGSTILGVLLGNCPGVFYAGELDAWLSREGVPNFGGEERERFWQRVGARMNGASDLYGSKARRHIEHSAAILRARPWRRHRELHRRYREIAEDLYWRIAEEADGTHVVDTSHYPLRARELQAIGGIDLYLVFLFRAPETVVASFRRRDVDQPSKRPLAANAYLHATHLLSLLVFLRQRRERRMMLRYEELLADPRGVLARLQEWIGVGAEPPDLSALRTGIPFQGNRLLRSERVEFRGGRNGTAQRDRLTRLLQAPWTWAIPRLRPSARPRSGAGR
jgi:sulfotransferase family protein